ncbi:MAG: 2-iminoacetate synthase ThiH [Candidatus Hydrogenedentota bacterium]
MSFYNELETINIKRELNKIKDLKKEDIQSILQDGVQSLTDFLYLISENAISYLEAMAQASQKITIKRFGKTISLYAPLYLSNECVSTCVYCGYSQTNKIQRKTLKFDEIEKECRYLKSKGFDDVLLVCGEHKKIINLDYLKKSVEIAHRYFSIVSIEVEPLEINEYEVLKSIGCDGVVCYQETYNPEIYKNYHLGGRKKDYKFRIETVERAAYAGVRFIGIGSLLGLNTWQEEAIYLYFHIKYLIKHWFRAIVSVSVPRICPSYANFEPPYPLSDKELVQLITVLRITFPDIGINLSTRESPFLRDNLMKLGITRMSAGSRTEPGGYINPDKKGEQFEVEDKRCIEEVVAAIKSMGYDPVLKYWDKIL